MSMIISFKRPDRYARWLPYLAIAGLCLLAGATAGEAAEPPPRPPFCSNLRSFREMGSVLYIAAHPDDENTLLIAYLARGRNYRTAYLSLTRGDGGQNVLGPEFGEELGVARTQELLAARRLDGGRQFFSRAVDFGFSKDYRETLNIWDKQQVLSDVVRVIREFRPDVLIVRFSPVPGGTHGHHTASTVLALEAFKLAGDTKAFPDQLRELAPWQPKRILWNAGGFPARWKRDQYAFGWKSAAMTRFPENRLPKLPRAAAPCTRPRALTISGVSAAATGREPSHSKLWTANLPPTTSLMALTPRGAACPAALTLANWLMRSLPNSILRILPRVCRRCWNCEAN